MLSLKDSIIKGKKADFLNRLLPYNLVSLIRLYHKVKEKFKWLVMIAQ